MEDLIALYLFKNKKCPLPQIGTLELTESNAVAMYAERKIHAAVPSVKLMDTITRSDDFINYIAERKNLGREEATSLLMQYCNKLQHMDAYGETKLPELGKFYVNTDGNLVFKSIELPTTLLPTVYADRVLHPSTSHNMVVGDKETTSAEMTAYYTDIEFTQKDKWWIFAIVFAIAGIAALLLYFNAASFSKTFGNSQKVQPATTTSTYRIVE